MPEPLKHLSYVTSPKLCLGEVEASASKLREGAALPKRTRLVALGPLPQTWPSGLVCDLPQLRRGGDLNCTNSA